MILENKYLKKAIAKAGYVVMVKTCHRTERFSKLEYISPNAGDIGMNIELLNKGLKLTEDYIHPEDRQKVISTVLDALSKNVKDYVHEYRMVGDDGHVYNVVNEINVTEISGDTFCVEFYIQDRARSASLTVSEAQDKKENGEYQEDGTPAGNLIDIRLKNMFEKLSRISGLYSVLVDNNGAVVCPPCGPDTNIGDFYDMFEKPAYKEYYKKLKEIVRKKGHACVLDREDDEVGKISPAPIKNNKGGAYFWIVGSYTEEETERLKTFCEFQWEIAKLVSENICQSEQILIQSAKVKGAGNKLRSELSRQNILNVALSKCGSRLVDSVDNVIEETLRDIGINLDLDCAFLYTLKGKLNKSSKLRYYWDLKGEAPDEQLNSYMAQRVDAVRDQIIKEQGIFIIDNNNMSEQKNLILLRYGVKAVVAQPVYRGDEMYAVLFYVDRRLQRVWTADEIRFMQNITLVVQNMLDEAEGDGNVRRVNKYLVDSYNNFEVGIFVRDAYSGEVLFANKKMNEMLGYDFVGTDSKQLIVDLHDRFDDITAMRKPFITKEKVVKWRKYIEPLGGIMDITEVRIEWLSGEPASLIILHEAKDY